MNAAELHRMAENCESAARRLATSEREGDRRDGEALAAAAAIHRRDAEKAERAEKAAQPARYWWHDRDE